MGERSEYYADTPPGTGRSTLGDAAMPAYTMRMVPDIPVFDPSSGQNFQEHGPHTAYMRWLLRQPGDLGRYRPADFHPLISAFRYAHYLSGGHRTSSMRGGEARNAHRQMQALTLGLCCGWRALDQVQARWLHAWLGSLVCRGLGGQVESWKGSGAERELARYCGEDVREHYTAAVASALKRIDAAGMMAVYDDACRFESWRDVEMLLMSAWRSGISLVDDEGYLVQGWKPRFALAFAMRFPDIS